MNHLRLLLTALLLAVLATICALAQTPTTSCPNNPQDDDLIAGSTCDQYNTLTSGQFQATPLIDGSMQDYGDLDHNVVSLYGTYGNNEKTASGAAHSHYAQGSTLAGQIAPLCPDGTTNCSDASKAIVFLYIGFSNTDIEIGGGSSDAWDNQDPHQAHLNGQPCSTLCENLNNPDMVPAWNQLAGDPTIQQSLLYLIYSPSTPLVGPHVVVFNGALGGQTLSKWDPTSIGYYAQSGANCPWDHQSSLDSECNYVRVKNDLTRNFYTQTDHYTEAQVQAVFIKTADSFPQCDLKKLYCSPGYTEPDAYTAERYLGDILRYLKCCKTNPYGTPPVPRYPNLKQVFITSRIYGGYGNGTAHGCLNPEPFAYELGFTVQRAIVAQINQTNNITNTDPYSGQLDYTVAPWFDWAPYLWASGTNISPGNLLNWCDSTTTHDPHCANNPGDVRYGDLIYPNYFGDHIHPTANGQAKVANQLLRWIQGTLPSAQSYISDWLGVGTSTPWIQK